MIEALTALVFVAVTLRMGIKIATVSEIAFCAALIALALCDLDHMRLPKSIIYVTAGIVSVLLLIAVIRSDDYRRLGVAALAGVVCFLAFYSVNFIKPKWIGFGDVRLAGLIGLALGWLGIGVVIFGFVLANFLGALTGTVLIAAGKLRRGTQIPFGVFLAIGSIIAVLVGTSVVHWYLSTLG